MPEKSKFNPVKILIIGQVPPPLGGQAINIQKIIHIIEEGGFDYRFVRMDFSNRMNHIGSFSFKKVFKLLIIISQILKELIIFRPNLVYYPPAGPDRTPIFRDFCLLFPIRLFRFKLIFHFHAGGLSQAYGKFNWFLKKVFRYIYFNADFSICLSKKGSADPIFLQSKKIVIIPSGVKNDTAFVSKETGGQFNVLFAGVCKESKGIIDFIEVIRQCRKSHPNIQGRIIGELFSKKEERYIEGAIKEGHIKYEGVVTGEAKNLIFQSSHLLLFPTFFESESFPTVILEAFSFGIPVVSTNWRGISDQITDGYNGFMHNVHDTDAMTKTVIQLADNNILYQKLSINARDDFEKKYNSDIFEDAIIRNLKEFI